MTSDNSCTFCRIVARREPASIVYEDDSLLAFLDVLPVNPGHMLVVPRTHSPRLADLDPDVGAQLFRAGQRLATALRASRLRCEGVNLLLNDGAEAGQRIFHAHLHVIPRVVGDSLARDLYGPVPTREELEETAAEIRKHLREETRL